MNSRAVSVFKEYIDGRELYAAKKSGAGFQIQYILELPYTSVVVLPNTTKSWNIEGFYNCFAQAIPNNHQ